MTILAAYGFLQTPAPVVNPGDAVEVQITPIQKSQTGLVVPQSQLMAMLTTLITTPNEWFGLTCHLFLNSFTPTPSSLLADFVAAEATFTGYAAQALVWLAPENNGALNADIPSQLLQFLSTAVPSPQTISGFFLTHA
jgi:hypothetical protein